ncbi:MAG: CotH kinase family protein [Saprospiraceae bacterium]
MKKFIILFLSLISFSLAAQTGTAPVRPLFEKKTVGEIRVKVANQNWADALDSLRIYGGSYMDATVSIDGVNYDGAGIRFRGNKSYATGLKRNPFAIKLNRADSVAAQNHQGYTTIKLSASVRDPSMIREVMFYEVASQYMPGLQACYTKLFINDEYVGVFVNVESVDNQMLQNNFHYSDGILFKAGTEEQQENLPSDCKQSIFGSLEYEDNIDCYRSNFDLASNSGWAELQELTRLLSQGSKEVEKALDVDNALWMLALNNVMVNLNSYSGNHSLNYYLYRDSNKLFQPIHWDLNLAFGSYKNTGNGSDLELKELQTLDPLLHADNPYKPLISQLLKDPLNRKIYLAHIRQINAEFFLNNLYERRAQELQGMIVVPFNDDKNKTYSLDDFTRSLKETIGKKSKIPGIIELMGKRSKFLKNHPELTSLPPMISEVTVQGRGKFENQPISAFNISAKADRFPKRMWLCYRFHETDPYTWMPMSENNTESLASGMKAFVTQVEAPSMNAEMEYYILAENAGTVGYSPSNYSKQAFKIKIEDLNK